MKNNEFALLGVSTELAESLQKHGLTEPTPIQREAIPTALTGKDIIAQAQTVRGRPLLLYFRFWKPLTPVGRMFRL